MHAGSLPSCPTICDPVDWACQASLPRRFSRQEYWSVLGNTGCHTLLECYISCCPSRQPLSTWCCQSPCDPSSCTASKPGPHRGRPKSSRAASGPNPSEWSTCRSGNNATVETQGRVAKEEDPTPSHQLYKLQIKSTWFTGRLCVYGIYKRTLSAPTKENQLVLIAVDIGSKNTKG